MNQPVEHQPDATRFLATVDDHEAELVYARVGDRVDLLHTRVPEAIAGQGIAGDLVQAALEFARAEGLKVVPSCSYAATYIQRHPAYQELLA